MNGIAVNQNVQERTPPEREIRALYDASTIRVYQAYSDAIADAALVRGTFVSPPFKMNRMTWIKPSFLWMMYRSGWGKKDAMQKRILAIDITREGFEWALSNACLSHFEANTDETVEAWREKMKQSCVRVQWDPERDADLEPLDYRAIQVGLGGEAVERYVNRWIVRLTEVTDLAHEVNQRVRESDDQAVVELLPEERPYPVSQRIQERLGMR